MNVEIQTNKKGQIIFYVIPIGHNNIIGLKVSFTSKNETKTATFSELSNFKPSYVFFDRDFSDVVYKIDLNKSLPLIKVISLPNIIDD